MAASSRQRIIGQALTGSVTVRGPTALESNQKAFVAFLKVSAIDAGTTLNAKIQHSPNGVDWFDLVSFTALVGVVGAQIKDQSQFSVPGANVLPYLQGVVTLAGGAPSATAILELWYDEGK